MKIVAIDASRGNFALNRTLIAVSQAAQDAGAEVTYLRLSDYRIYDCTSCKLCVMGDGCKMGDDLPELLEAIDDAHGIIISTPDDKTRTAKSLRAFLSRLSKHFEDNDARQPTLPGFGSPNAYLSEVAMNTKRAIIITSQVSNGGIGAYFAPSGAHGAQVRRIRRSLAACNINAVGSLEIGRKNLREDELCQESSLKARTMGRLIVGRI
ncbi:MAG: NAD(P)H-dependent oxidoreductase [Coriobacteriia bacterium]|nr:NAD(P)H-dependent oxidoreductase [Coriobacteriia bacterium]